MRSRRYYLVRSLVRTLFRLAVLLMGLLALHLMFSTLWDSLFWVSIITVGFVVLSHRRKQATVAVTNGHTLEELLPANSSH